MVRMGVIPGAVFLIAVGVLATLQHHDHAAQLADSPAGAQSRPGATNATGESADELLRVVRSDRGQADVLFRQRDAWANLTRFSRPQVIFDFAVSKDKRWAYVWHHERPPRVLSIYDLHSLRQVCSFSPGTGGSLKWTPGNTVLHEWGAGTNACAYAVYDVRGKTILKGMSSGIEASPGCEYLATFPTTEAADEPVSIRDLRTMQVIYTSSGNDDVKMVEQVTWLGNGVVAVQYMDSNQQSRQLSVHLQLKSAY